MSSTLVVSESKIPEGYSLGSVISSQFSLGHNHWLICDVCRRETHWLTRVENDYPNNPDLRVCHTCLEKAGLT